MGAIYSIAAYLMGWNSRLEIQFISDLHLELLSPKDQKFIMNNIRPKNPILIVAGDIGCPFESHYCTFLENISQKFEKIFIISGNHEYHEHGHTILDTDAHIEKLVSAFPNISFLNNRYEEYKDFYFIGTTLWGHINYDNENMSNDHHLPYISYDIRATYGLNTVNEYNEVNNKAVDFIKNTLTELQDKKKIVITHHIPHPALIDQRYKFSVESNQLFCCDLSSIIQDSNIICWLYGHTHTYNYQIINNTVFTCNPVGYKGENASVDYNKGIVIEH